MTQDEADKLGLLIGTADGGCSTCVDFMAKRAANAFPEWSFVVTEEEQREQYEWSDDPEETQLVGYVVKAIPVNKEAS